MADRTGLDSTTLLHYLAVRRAMVSVNHRYRPAHSKITLTYSLTWQTDRGVRHGASRRTRFRNPLDFTWISDFRLDFCISHGFLDFKVDFWISKWISGFQSGFLDFKVDFRISKWISGFQSGISGFQSRFLDFKVDFYISKWILHGFCLKNYCYSEDTAHEQWRLLSPDAHRIQCHRHFIVHRYAARTACIHVLAYIVVSRSQTLSRFSCESPMSQAPHSSRLRETSLVPRPRPIFGRGLETRLLAYGV